jgi:hypothetical protein
MRAEKRERKAIFCKEQHAREALGKKDLLTCLFLPSR